MNLTGLDKFEGTHEAPYAELLAKLRLRGRRHSVGVDVATWRRRTDEAVPSSTEARRA